MTRLAHVLLTSALVMAPLCANSADLVVWWENGWYPQEDEAVGEIIAAFEQQTGKQVDLVIHPEAELPSNMIAALDAGQPPDFVFGTLMSAYVSE